MTTNEMSPRVAQDVAGRRDLGPVKIARFGLHLYIVLWVLEGGVRKWVPGTENIFYIIRDLLTLVVILFSIAAAGRKDRGSRYSRLSLCAAVTIFAFTIFSMVQALLLELEPSVFLVGLRSYVAPFLPLLLCFLAQPDALLFRALFRNICIFGVLQSVFVIAQVLSPANSLINFQVGTDSAYFLNDGIVRASGTFSAPAGLTLFVPVVLASALALLATRWQRPIVWIASAGLVSQVVIVALGGSRGAVLGAVWVLTFYAFGRVFGWKNRPNRSLSTTFLTLALSLVLVFFLFQTVIDSLIARFQTAAVSENSFSRLLSQTFEWAGTTPSFVGGGVGSFSQAGISLGASNYWEEIESVKWVLELGFLGYALAMARLIVVASLLLLAARRPDRTVRLLFLAVAVPILAYGQITQFPSAQATFAFVILTMGCTGTLWSRSKL